ncbi:MAG: alginate O-acetyltransferase complex protein AlgI, partial [Myxococcales bacterium]|nr:alginate O-acetyltransferase complex protein AlgI [Myxococcales bacterium]
KYAGWFATDLDWVLGRLHARTFHVPALALPLGISFFTFHKISYKVDVYRGVTAAQRNPATLALYILFFPQLIAGPIVRYHEISDQLGCRTVTGQDFALGIRRIIIGMSKKVLIANSVALAADHIFNLATGALGPATCWLGLTCYTLQIYFDFSGYSDMAIGLALLFGFRFPENFDHPYASSSVTEFWRRWHMSLSRWFRDYLYVPLGGNRLGRRRTYLNLLIIFTLCGLWHGASWEFLVWGLFHGLFLVIERLGFGSYLLRLPSLVRRSYTLLVVMVGWVFFRAGSLARAFAWLRSMAGHVGPQASEYPPGLYVDRWVLTMMAIGIVVSFPLRTLVARRATLPGASFAATFHFASAIGLAVLFSLSLTFIAAGTYSPFLYFRF